MKKFKWTILWCCIGLVVYFGVASLAYNLIFGNQGEKQSVYINFSGLEGHSYYVTLLSQEKSTGAHSWDDPEMSGVSFQYSDINEAFEAYVDEHGFYYLNYFEDCSQTHRFRWEYDAPNWFKILIYFPENGQYSVSREVYAMDRALKVIDIEFDEFPGNSF